jgi:hypothetical protein
MRAPLRPFLTLAAVLGLLLAGAEGCADPTGPDPLAGLTGQWNVASLRWVGYADSTDTTELIGPSAASIHFVFRANHTYTRVDSVFSAMPTVVQLDYGRFHVTPGGVLLTSSAFPDSLLWHTYQIGSTYTRLEDSTYGSPISGAPQAAYRVRWVLDRQ